METYPKQIADRIGKTRHAGKLENFNVCGTEVSFICGTITRFFLKIDFEQKQIDNISFQTNACGFVVAAADFFAEEVKGKPLTELGGLNHLRIKAETVLGSFPEDRRHCLSLAFDALQAAFADLRKKQLKTKLTTSKEFKEETALICTCFGISEDTIEECIIKMNTRTTEEVGKLCRAGTGCGSCKFLIQEIIDQYQTGLF